MALAEIGRGIPGLTFVEVQDDDARALLGEEASGRRGQFRARMPLP